MTKRTILAIMIVLLMCGSMINAQGSGAIIYDVPEDDLMRMNKTVPGFGLSEQEISDINSFQFDADTLKVLVIMVHWSDRLSTWGKPTLDSMMFSENVYPSGSLADYYDEVSYGNITVVGDVIDWFDAGSYSPYFNFESLLPAMDHLIDYSKYDGNNDGVVDAVTFLRSGNGKEDTGDSNDIWSHAVSYAIGSGPGPYDGMRISRWNTAPETRPLRNQVFPKSFTGVDSLNRIRVFAHELAHNLGLPDLYDYDNKLDTATYTVEGDNNDHPVMDWGVMGYAGYGLFSIRSPIPSHFCGWSKKTLGWIEPIHLEGEFTDLVIKDIETHDDSSLYLVNINEANGEYFLLEYRNSQSTSIFDKVDSDFSVYFWPYLIFGSEPLESGLLITHIDDSVSSNGWGANNGTPGYQHYKVKVEDVGYNPDRDYTTNPEGTYSDSAQWWYPYETRKAATFNNNVPGKELFSPTTIPNSDGYTGPSGITIRVDSIVGDRLYMYVNNPNSTDYDNDGLVAANDNCPNTFNPNQTDIDFDGVGDSCDTCSDSDGDGFGNTQFSANSCPDDNCPDIANVNQADADLDGIGDACDDCTDTDGDGYGDPGFSANTCVVDNCPDIANPDQSDVDVDGIGDVCDGCCLGDRGNIDGDINDEIDISDLVFMVSYMFQAGDAPPCIEEADVDGSTEIDISDIVMLVAYMFSGGDAPVICP